MFHDSNSESGSDSFLPIFPETRLLYGCLVSLSGDQFDNGFPTFAEFSMFVSHEWYESDVAGCRDMAVFVLFGKFFGLDGKTDVRVDITGDDVLVCNMAKSNA